MSKRDGHRRQGQEKGQEKVRVVITDEISDMGVRKDAHSVYRESVLACLKTMTPPTYHDDIKCPECGEFSRPQGVGERKGDQIQMVLMCRNCKLRFWYWHDKKSILTAFKDD